MSLRDLAARVVPNTKSCHLAHSSGIAHAVVCGLKFKLPNFMGATPRGDESYISGQIAHAALENSVDTLKDLWHPSVTSQRIIDTWRPYIDDVYKQVRQNADNNPSIKNIEHYIAQAETRLRGIADVLQRIISHNPPPSQIITEITICNTDTRHEGRVDAI